MKTRIFVGASTLMFVLVLLGHAVRLMEGWPVLVGPFSVPVWASVLAVLVSSGVAVWGLSLLHKQS